MAVWQKRARFGVAIVFLASAAVVYFAIGRRPPQAAQTEVERIDPAASQESSGCTVTRWRGQNRDFELTCDTQLAYPDGTVRMIQVKITVKKDDGRSYVVTAGEARSEQHQNRLQLSSGVTLRASDGFELVADRATYIRQEGQEQGSIHSDVPVSFSKGRMRGSGTVIDYNENTDILTIGQDAKVITIDEQGTTTLDFSAGTAVLDRLQDILTMDGRVHVLRDQQVMDADRAVARLSHNEEFITFIELRGGARVEGGGGSLDAMSARDIDLDYTDDGVRLERVALSGAAGVTLTGTAGAAGRQLTGESLDVRLGSDGTVTSAVGRENVRMFLPAAPGAPARSVRARTLDASGAPGQGLTSADFTDAVEYSEEPTQETQKRIVRSRRLDLELSGDAVTHATFTGEVTFEEPTFRAQANEARYEPSAGSLHLTGSDSRGLPCMADDRIAVDAETIDITVDTRRLKADRRVKTTIRPDGAASGGGSSPCAVARQRATTTAPARPPAAGDEATRLPGLLKQDQIANAAADALEYGGTGKALVYTGNASLVQGETSLRGNVIRIDQERGDLIVTGGASSRTVQGTGPDRDIVRGVAEEIRYSDAEQMVSYLNAPASGQPAPGKLVQVNGPQGNLTATKIDMVLNRDSGRAERLEAYQNVTAKIDATKTATADRLTYLAATDQYDMKGAGAVPVRVTDSCAETSGKTLTYFKANNTIRVHGNDEMRTQKKTAGCPQSPAPAASR